MTVGILGLGLIGGSLARAYNKKGHTVHVWDRDQNMLEFAKLSGVVIDTLAGGKRQSNHPKNISH